jgi:hypothetical protein
MTQILLLGAKTIPLGGHRREVFLEACLSFRSGGHILTKVLLLEGGGLELASQALRFRPELLLQGEKALLDGEVPQQREETVLSLDGQALEGHGENEFPPLGVGRAPLETLRLQVDGFLEVGK